MESRRACGAGVRMPASERSPPAPASVCLPESQEHLSPAGVLTTPDDETDSAGIGRRGGWVFPLGSKADGKTQGLS